MVYFLGGRAPKNKYFWNSGWPCAKKDIENQIRGHLPTLPPACLSSGWPCAKNPINGAGGSNHFRRGLFFGLA